MGVSFGSNNRTGRRSPDRSMQLGEACSELFVQWDGSGFPAFGDTGGHGDFVPDLAAAGEHHRPRETGHFTSSQTRFKTQ